jgi:hypothetical protein
MTYVQAFQRVVRTYLLALTASTIPSEVVDFVADVELICRRFQVDPRIQEIPLITQVKIGRMFYQHGLFPVQDYFVRVHNGRLIDPFNEREKNVDFIEPRRYKFTYNPPQFEVTYRSREWLEENERHQAGCGFLSLGKIDPENKPMIGYAYFIQNSLTNNIKIGCAQDPVKRMADLQVGNDGELKLIRSEHSLDMYAREAALHKQFETSWLRGDWFLPSGELLEYIQKGDERCPDNENH